jgi:hypothetical protein
MSNDKKARTKRRRDVLGADGVVALVIAILSGVWLIESLRVGSSPGMEDASVFPFWLSLFCLAIAGLWLTDVLRSSRAKEFSGPTSLTLLVFAALVGYAIAAPYLGFEISTFLFLLVTLAAFKKYTWWKLTLVAGISSFLFHLLFSKWLFIPFPRGVLY